MRILVTTAALACLASTAASAQRTTHVEGYQRSNGTYVQPHQRTTPDQTRNDNWSTRGNVNPNTGVAGTKPRDGESSYRPYSPYKPR